MFFWWFYVQLLVKDANLKNYPRVGSLLSLELPPTLGTRSPPFELAFVAGGYLQLLVILGKRNQFQELPKSWFRNFLWDLPPTLVNRSQS